MIYEVDDYFWKWDRKTVASS